MSFPRENLVRATPKIALERAAGAEMPTLTGHFAVWDQWTEINSPFEGNFMERFAPTSLTKTLSESTPKVLFQHGQDPQIGNKPLGTPTRVEPDSTGAFYEVALLDTSYNRDLVPGLEAGLYGASFRLSVVREDVVQRPKKSDYNPKGIPERTVQEARVMEFGPVTFPAYANATAGVRSLTDFFLPAAASRVSPRSLSPSPSRPWEKDLWFVGADAKKKGETTKPFRFRFVDPTAYRERKSPPPRVILSSDARKHIRDHHQLGHVEIGGPLFGFRYADAIWIGSAYNASRDNYWDAMSINTDLVRELQQQRPGGQEWIGEWHSHPRSRANGPMYSQADLRGWRGYGEDQFLGLIVGPNYGVDAVDDEWREWRWDNPDFGAWVITANDVCAAELQIERDNG